MCVGRISPGRRHITKRCYETPSTTLHTALKTPRANGLHLSSRDTWCTRARVHKYHPFMGMKRGFRSIEGFLNEFIGIARRDALNVTTSAHAENIPPRESRTSARDV